MRSKKREEYEAEIRTIVDKMKIVSSSTALKFMEEDIAKLEQQIIDLETRDDEIESKEGVDMAKAEYPLTSRSLCNIMEVRRKA